MSLETAVRHIRLVGEACIARQRALIAELRQRGQSINEAERLLKEFEQIHRRHEQDLAEIEDYIHQAKPA